MSETEPSKQTCTLYNQNRVHSGLYPNSGADSKEDHKKISNAEIKNTTNLTPINLQ